VRRVVAVSGEALANPPPRKTFEAAGAKSALGTNRSGALAISRRAWPVMREGSMTSDSPGSCYDERPHLHMERRSFRLVAFQRG